LAKQSNSDYLWDKLRMCDALMAEKEATIVRLKAENKALQHRRDRIARHWKESVKREGVQKKAEDVRRREARRQHEASWRANP